MGTCGQSAPQPGELFLHRLPRGSVLSASRGPEMPHLHPHPHLHSPTGLHLHPPVGLHPCTLPWACALAHSGSKRSALALKRRSLQDTAPPEEDWGPSNRNEKGESSAWCAGDQLGRLSQEQWGVHPSMPVGWTRCNSSSSTGLGFTHPERCQQLLGPRVRDPASTHRSQSSGFLSLRWCHITNTHSRDNMVVH